MTCDIMNRRVSPADQRLAILDCLAAASIKHGKKYTVPYQRTIQKWIKLYKNLDMSLRTLNRRLAELSAAKYIIRNKRHCIKKSGELWLRSSYYYLSGKCKEIVENTGKSVKNIVRFLALPKLANNIFTTKRVFKKVASESGILPQNGQFKPPPDDQVDPADIKAFNLKLRNDLIRQKIGR